MDREGIAKHWDLVKAFKNGADIQFRLNSSEPWVCSVIPIFAFESEYRIKPEMKVVDLGVLIKSGIDCEFSSQSFKEPAIGLLRWANNSKYMSTKGVSFSKVRPRMNHLHAWAGGSCPLPEGFTVEVMLATGKWSEMGSVSATRFEWGHCIYTQSRSSEIIGFRVRGLVDGYCYPWEEK